MIALSVLSVPRGTLRTDSANLNHSVCHSTHTIVATRQCLSELIIALIASIVPRGTIRIARAEAKLALIMPSHEN